MMTTAVKQMIIATISTTPIRSLSTQKAIIETQNGLVYQQTIVREMGAYTAAMCRMTKFV